MNQCEILIIDLMRGGFEAVHFGDVGYLTLSDNF